MIKMVITFNRREGMSQQDFRDYRRQVHAPMLLAIPESRLIRKFVVSYPEPGPGDAPPFCDAMVEAWFESRADLDAMFGSDNFVHKVDPDHVNFIDLPSIRRMVCEEITVVG